MKVASQGVDAVLRGAVDAGKAPGIVAAVGGRDGMLYEQAFGRARTAGESPMRVDTILRIASMTKPVTTLAVLMLHEQGRLDLDAPLAEYLPDYRQPEVLERFDMHTGRYETRPAKTAVTIRQLLSHTSGYGYWFLHAPLYRLTDGAPALFDPPFLMFEPGTRFAYSVSMDVLGQVVPAISGLGLAEFFADRIFAPLKMRDTGYELPADIDRLGTVHARREGGYTEATLERTSHDARGGGGLYSTAPDYLRLVRFFLNGGELDGVRLLEASTVARMCSNQIGALYAARQTTAFPGRTNDFLFMDGSQKFGLGFMIETRDGSAGRKTGTLSWAGIANTYFWIDPQTGIGAVLCMQTTPFSDPVSVDIYRRFERAVYDSLFA